MDAQQSSHHGVTSRRQGTTAALGDIRAQVQQLVLRQHRFDEALARHLAVDPAGLETMDYLIAAGSSTPTELARHTGLSTAAMTLVLNRLENAGHLTREPHPTDGRKLTVTAAHRSAARADALVAPLVEGIGRTIDGLAPEEREAVTRFLADIIAVYERATIGDREQHGSPWT